MLRPPLVRVNTVKKPDPKDTALGHPLRELEDSFPSGGNAPNLGVAGVRCQEIKEKALNTETLVLKSATRMITVQFECAIDRNAYISKN